MGKTMKAVTLWSVAVALTLGVSACTVKTPSSDERREAAIVELEQRGFHEPMFLADTYADGKLVVQLIAKLGQCTIAFSQFEDGRIVFQDGGWSEGQLETAVEASGLPMDSTVSADFVREQSGPLNWGICLQGTPDK